MLTEISKLDSKSAIKEKSKPSVSHSEEKSQKFSGESDFNGFDQEPENKLTAFNKFLNNLGIDPPTEVSDPLHSKKDVSIDKPDQEDGMVVDNDGDNSIDSGDSDKMEIDIDADKNNTDIESENKATNTENTKHSKDSEEKLPTSGDIVDSVQPTQKMSPVTTNMKGEGGKVEFCGTCDSQVDDAEEGICCDGQCERWFHLRCSGLTKTEYDALGLDENAKWSCGKCSGKPKQPAANQKPLLSVRKDLGPILTPPPALKRRSVNTERKTPKVDIANPAYLKPFDFGWKRELVYRSTNDTQNRRQGDIYYYTPKGKKLRSLREISDHLVGVDLTIDNFTFWKEPLGVDDQAKEIIRDAKLKLVNKDTTASPGIVQKKLLTPKTPKPIKTTPKVTATIAPFEAKSSPKNTPTGTPRVVLKKPVAAATKFKVTPNKAATSTITTTPNRIVIGKEKKKKINNDELEMGMLPPTWEPIPKPKEKCAGVKRPLEDTTAEGTPEQKKVKHDRVVNQNFMQDHLYLQKALLLSFQYLKVQELLRASRVCQGWNTLAFAHSLWKTVRMKNSQVRDWEGFSATLRKVGTQHLDLRKILMPDKQEPLKLMWNDCAKALGKVNTLVKIDLCRCTSYLLEQISVACPQLESISAGTIIKSNQVNLECLKNCENLKELKIKSQGGTDIVNMSVLGGLTKLKHLSLTTVTNINAVLEVVGNMPQLESLELGDFISAKESLVTESMSRLQSLKRLRLEKGQESCPTLAILNTISKLPNLIQLELINFDVKVGFDDALGLCSNIKLLLIIPTYVTQSATTNHLVIEGVTKLSKTLNHFVWGLTLELLRVTDLFIDQWENHNSVSKKNPNPLPPPKKSGLTGDSIPILKPQMDKDGKKPVEGGVTQVDVLQLPKLHKVLSALLPSSKIFILKVPYSATWRQTIASTTH